MIEYQKNANWSLEFIKSLTERLGLTFKQVYMWRYMQSKKDILEGNAPPGIAMA